MVSALAHFCPERVDAANARGKHCLEKRFEIDTGTQLKQCDDVQIKARPMNSVDPENLIMV